MEISTIMKKKIEEMVSKDIAADKTGYLAGDGRNNHLHDLKADEHQDGIRTERFYEANCLFFIGKVGVQIIIKK